MSQQPTDDQLERRLVDVLSFMFLFKFVTNKDLGILGSSLLGVNDMRATLHLLLKRKWIASFKITIPVQAVGYYLLKDGLAKLPEAYLGYQYFFFPTRYKRSTFYHLAGVIEVFLMIKKMAPKGAFWLSEWMVRQRKVRGIKDKILTRQLAWRKKGVYGGRLPDGLFVISKKARIAIEYESTRKNNDNWERMIKGLEDGLRLKEKIELATLDTELKRDFEAVLFVFNDQISFISYLRKFGKSSKVETEGTLDFGLLKGPVSLKRYFLGTLDELKKGHVFRTNGGRIAISEMFNFVESGAVNN